MPDLDLIKQGKQGVGWRARLPEGRPGRPRGRRGQRQPQRGRERDAVCFRFAASNGETGRGRGAEQPRSLGPQPARADFDQSRNRSWRAPTM
jgi:hypothetical protein